MDSPTPSQVPVTVRVFAQRFRPTCRGARVARILVEHQLESWGFPRGEPFAGAASIIVAELTANAASHGRVPGRDFGLCLFLDDAMLRVEVTDTRTGRSVPEPGNLTVPSLADEGGRGLLLVEAVASRWGVKGRGASPGKTVWAELDLPAQ